MIKPYRDPNSLKYNLKIEFPILKLFPIQQRAAPWTVDLELLDNDQIWLDLSLKW